MCYACMNHLHTTAIVILMKGCLQQLLLRNLFGDVWHIVHHVWTQRIDIQSMVQSGVDGALPCAMHVWTICTPHRLLYSSCNNRWRFVACSAPRLDTANWCTVYSAIQQDMRQCHIWTACSTKTILIIMRLATLAMLHIMSHIQERHKLYVTCNIGILWTQWSYKRIYGICFAWLWHEFGVTFKCGRDDDDHGFRHVFKYVCAGAPLLRPFAIPK